MTYRQNSFIVEEAPFVEIGEVVLVVAVEKEGLLLSQGSRLFEFTQTLQPMIINSKPDQKSERSEVNRPNVILQP
ncbi:10856_t:CDS:2 [Funneliformis mosseae]|uniref:10856_t:CDS:1 n=1 Tax=Funneliformis mosseae TaxID=27381 RepID=A0A9N8WC78_FUNMO|nr:10856_t:CDS:2 [Funneliformis mosseae]